MGEQYELYCVTDARFYEAPDGRGEAGLDLPIARRPVPDGWERQVTETWVHQAPAGAAVPMQGWKVHVSARLADVERTLDAVWDHCVARGIPFKFLRSEAVVVMMNSKSAPRASSGKLATVYPADEPACETLLRELGETLAGVEGPYVLSDLRIGAGPLYVRYGGFVNRWCTSPSGERVLALEDPDGALVPDLRGPTFALPPWLPLPAFLEPHLAARNAVTTHGLPYEIESVIHFSNGGGVYLARDTRDGARVVLKEGRPHAGLDLEGRDAVARIAHERGILERLAGLDVVPALREAFTLGEHHFLVEEFLDATPLQRMVVSRFPLTHPDPSPAELAEYADWALAMLADLEGAVAALHARGVAFCDLHPENVLITTDGRLVLIDFEVASPLEDEARSSLAHPGYAAPRDRRGAAVDSYALACLHLTMFAPQTTILVPLERGKAAHIADLVAETFPVPREALDRAVAEICGEDGDRAGAVFRGLPMPGEAPWTGLRDAMATAILASATPGRDDRLFPGDPDGFRPGGGLSLAHGAAGVLTTLAATGAARSPELEGWLCDHALRADRATPAGLWDGLAGVAWALETLGHRTEALAVADRAAHGEIEPGALGLRDGLSGVGLALLHLGEQTGETGLTDLAWQVVGAVADRLGGPDDVPELSGGDHPRAGLMHGSSGPALLLVRAHESRPDPHLLDRARVALAQDLRRCVTAADGTIQVNQGWRTLPYLDEGSAGIALAVARYLQHRHDEELRAALDGLLAVAATGFVVQPGLLTGRAGLIAANAACGRLVPGAGVPAGVGLRGLRWHALPFAGGLAFPGDALLRLSMDLATGTAGALLAVGAAIGDRPVHLPLLEPATGGRAPEADRDAPGGTRLAIPTTG